MTAGQTQAEQQAAYRRRHRETYRARLRWEQAKRAAAMRMARTFPDVFDRFLAAELISRGLSLEPPKVPVDQDLRLQRRAAS